MMVRCPLSTTCTRCAAANSRRVAQPIVLHRLDAGAEQPRHLARMRRDDHVDAVAAHQPIRLAGERIQRIGVENERTPARSSSACTKAAVPGDWPSPGPTAITSALISSTRSSAA